MAHESPERWRRILELFEAAMERPPAERRAFLRESCGGDAGLRQKVEELLEDSDQAASFLEHPPLSQAARLLRKAAGDPLPAPSPSPSDDRSVAPTATVPPAAKPAETIGAYRLLQRIGEGGMGEVWQAQQNEPIKRRVALKLIKAGMDTKQVIARFEAERQALALMDHPGIAKVFEAGETPRGLPYFAMEYVAGEPITAYCDRQRLTVRERLDLFMQLCEGVQHAHHKGVIHRDLKPSNVLVSVQDGKPVPKIIDFGVAKATTQRLTERTMFTEMGALVGTPEYMSPEQAEMTGLDVDTRTDVYSLGVMLYELLTGTLPFGSKELRKEGFEEIRRRIREVDPQRPSARLRTLGERTTDAANKRKTDPGRLISSLRGELDWIVMKALEKDRTRRYATPHDLGADVERHLGHVPVVAGPPGTGYRARKFLRRHSLGAGIAAAALAGLVGFGVMMAVQARRMAAERDRAERVTRFLVELFRESNPSEARGNEVTAREVLDRGARRIGRELASEPLVKAQMLATIGEVYSNLGLIEEAEPLLGEAIDIRNRELGPEHPDTLRVRSRFALVLDMKGQYGEADELLREVWDVQRRILGGEHPDALWTRLRIGFNAYRLGNIADSERITGEVYEARRRILGEDHQDTLVALGLHAVAIEKSGRYAEAEEVNRRVVQGQRKALGEDHPSTLWAVQNLAATVEWQGRYEEAEDLYREAYEGMMRVLGEDHPDTLWVKHNLGNVALSQGHFDEAERIFGEVLETRRDVLGPEHPRTLVTLHTRAFAAYRRGDLDAAERIYREALESRRRVLGPEHPRTLATLNGLGAVAYRRRHLDEAERIFAEVLEIRRLVLGPEHSGTLDALMNLANVKADQGRNEEAEQILRRILEVRLRTSGAEDPRTLMVMNNLANVYTSLKRYDEAETMFLDVIDKTKSVLGPRHPDIMPAMYNLGCLASLRGRRTEAIDWLRQAVDAGYEDADFMTADPDMQPLLGDPEFEALVAAARRNAEARGRGIE